MGTLAVACLPAAELLPHLSTVFVLAKGVAASRAGLSIGLKGFN